MVSSFAFIILCYATLSILLFSQNNCFEHLPIDQLYDGRRAVHMDLGDLEECAN